MTGPDFAKSNPDLNNCLALMHTLMEYRPQPIFRRLHTIGANYSMLHLDVLALLYHFGKICSGHVLEIGAYVGGATIAVALGVQDSRNPKKIISIEPGGKLDHPTLGSSNICKDFRKNLTKHGLSQMVSLVEGASFDPATIARVQKEVGPQEVGLLLIDSGGAAKTEIACYEDRLSPDCLVVIDDYYNPGGVDKSDGIRAVVDSLVADGSLIPLGFYGYGTWFGRRHGSTHT